jgi:plastocyanin
MPEAAMSDATIGQTTRVGRRLSIAAEANPWRAMVLRSGMALAAGFIVLMVLARFPIPPLAIYVVLVAGGLVLRRRKPTAGLLVVGVSTLLIFGLNLGPLVDNLRRPADPVDFTLAVLGWTAAVCTAAAIVPAVRRASGSGVSRGLSMAAVAAVALALVGSSVARLATVDSVAALSGDTGVVIAQTAFPETVSVNAGEVALFVDNSDPYSHTFTIDELGVDQTLVAGQSARVTFSTQPGEYRYYCAIPGHEFMEGTLLVD